jgi:2-polyprenyl-3-methyl-5-hydroxy-6-metoxy-1,4-benzoquinol methylase
MINDNTKVSSILNELKNNKECYFVFDPEKSHYTNSMAIYRAIRKKTYEQYYGVKDPKKKLKNAFSNWKTPLEIFHRQRNVMVNISQQVGRLGYLIQKDYELKILGNNKPEIKYLEEVIESRLKEFNKYDSYKMPDYFLPVNMLNGLITAQEWQKKGIEITNLDNQLIYPLYGVWPPTSQEYLTLVDLYMKSHKSPKEIKNVADLGCGTGVLGILVGKHETSGEIVAIDNYPNAVECTKMNAQIHGLGTKIKTLLFDLTKLYHNKKLFNISSEELVETPSLRTPAFLEEVEAYKHVVTELGIPSKYDLILWNPPWLPAKKLVEINPLDNGVYDPEEIFI